MWARMRTHHIEEVIPAGSIKIKKSSAGTKSRSKSNKKNNWRDLFSEELENYGEQGLYLKGLRLREGYTQARLGELIGISPNNISAMEHGRRPISKTVAKLLGEIFEVNYQRFL